MIPCYPDHVDVLTAPVVEPVSLADARHQVGLYDDQDEHNLFLAQKIAAGRRLIEKRLNVTMVETQFKAVWRACETAFEADARCRPRTNALSYRQAIHLPAPPVLVDGTHPITVVVDGTELAAEDFSVDADLRPGEITFRQRTFGKVVVEWWAGKLPGVILCPLLHSAILMYVDHAFRNRGILADDQTVVLPYGFDDLLAASSWSGRY